MLQALIGKKIDQTQLFLENGRRIPVTGISMLDNTIIQTKTNEKEKYAAVQLGYGVKKKPTKALVGHVKKAGLENVPTVIREVVLRDVADADLPKAGDTFSVDSIFKPGDVVKVVGTSKGKGFAGGVKRHGFRGGPKTHGQSDRHRAPGSIGQTTTPGRVYKGKRMAGRMGSETVSITNLTVVEVDAVGKMLYVLGLVPGHKNATVFVVRTGELKNFVPLLTPLGATEEPKLAEEVSEAPEVASEEVVEEKVEEETPAEEVAIVEEKEEEGK